MGEAIGIQLTLPCFVRLGCPMGFMTHRALTSLGFRSLGRDVQISDRASIYNFDSISIGDFSRIDDFCVVSGNLNIGRNVHVTVFCNLAGGDPGIFIDDFSTLAYGCHIFSQSDDYSGKAMVNSTIPKRFKDEKKAPVQIGRHCILGAGTMVLPGVDLPEGVASGARTLFVRSVEPWSIYVGSPARKLRDRKRDLLRLETEFLSDCESAQGRQ